MEVWEPNGEKLERRERVREMRAQTNREWPRDRHSPVTDFEPRPRGLANAAVEMGRDWDWEKIAPHPIRPITNSFFTANYRWSLISGARPSIWRLKTPKTSIFQRNSFIFLFNFRRQKKRSFCDSEISSETRSNRLSFDVFARFLRHTWAPLTSDIGRNQPIKFTDVTLAATFAVSWFHLLSTFHIVVVSSNSNFTLISFTPTWSVAF